MEDVFCFYAMLYESYGVHVSSFGELYANLRFAAEYAEED